MCAEIEISSLLPTMTKTSLEVFTTSLYQNKGLDLIIGDNPHTEKHLRTQSTSILGSSLDTTTTTTTWMEHPTTTMMETAMPEVEIISDYEQETEPEWDDYEEEKQEAGSSIEMSSILMTMITSAPMTDRTIISFNSSSYTIPSQYINEIKAITSTPQIPGYSNLSDSIDFENETVFGYHPYYGLPTSPITFNGTSSGSRTQMDHFVMVISNVYGLGAFALMFGIIIL